MKRSVLLIGLMLFGIVPMSVSAKPNDMRRAYEDGWKWYVYRKSQGADEGELLDILQTLKQKYGHTYFNMDRVDRALDELGGGTQNDAQAPAENFSAPADYSPAVVTHPAPAVP